METQAKKSTKVTNAERKARKAKKINSANALDPGTRYACAAGYSAFMVVGLILALRASTFKADFQGEDSVLLNGVIVAATLMFLSGVISTFALFDGGWQFLALLCVINVGIVVLLCIGSTFSLIVGIDAAYDPVHDLMDAMFGAPLGRAKLWDHYCQDHQACGHFRGLARQSINSTQSDFPPLDPPIVYGAPNTVAFLFSDCSQASIMGGLIGGQNIGISQSQLLAACVECADQCRLWLTGDLKGNMEPATVTVFLLCFFVLMTTMLNDALISQQPERRGCRTVLCDSYTEPSILRCNVYGCNLMVAALGLTLAIVAVISEVHLEKTCVEVATVECPTGIVSAVVTVGLALLAQGGTVFAVLRFQLGIGPTIIRLLNIGYVVAAFLLLVCGVFLSTTSGEFEPVPITVEQHFGSFRRRFRADFPSGCRINAENEPEDRGLCTSQIADYLEKELSEIGVISAFAAVLVAIVTHFSLRAVWRLRTPRWWEAMMREKMKYGPDGKPQKKSKRSSSNTSAEMTVASSSEDESGSEWETATETETESEYGVSTDSQQLSVDVEQPSHNTKAHQKHDRPHHHKHRNKSVSSVPIVVPKAPTAAEKRARIAAAKDAARSRVTADQAVTREKQMNGDRKKLKELRLGPLQRRATAEGVDEHSIDTALESGDPAAAVIELIVQKLDAEEETHRKQAIEDEVKAAAEDEESRVKDEVEYALAAAQEERERLAAEEESAKLDAERAAADEAARMAAAKTLFATAIADEEASLRKELAELRLGPLQRRARNEEIDDDSLDTALEAATPMVAIIDLIVTKHMAEFKPSGASLSTVNPAFVSNGSAKTQQTTAGWSEMTLVDSDGELNGGAKKSKQPTKLADVRKQKKSSGSKASSSSAAAEMIVVQDSDEDGDASAEADKPQRTGLRKKLAKKREKKKARHHIEKMLATQEKLDNQVRKRQQQEEKKRKKNAAKHSEGILLANPMFGLDDSLDEGQKLSSEEVGTQREKQKEAERLRKKAARQPQAILKKRMRGTYTTCAEAVVRERYDVTSTKVGAIKQPGVYVEVTDARETEHQFIRVKIRPSQYENKEAGFQIVYSGWCSVVSKSGVPILRKLTQKELDKLEEARWDEEAED